MKRTIVLVTAALVLLAALLLRGWGHASLDKDTSIEIGLRDTWECDLEYGCRSERLRDLDKIDEGGETEGEVALVLGVFAVGALAAASALSRKPTRTPIAGRIALASICALSAIASLIFAARLGSLHWLDLGWAPYAALASTIVGGIAILNDRRES
jgi:hypothetical protein